MAKTIADEKPFPDSLEERVNSLANVVNNEFKSLALLHLDTKHALKGHEVYLRVAGTLQHRYLPQKKSFSVYCSESFYPAGVVARETFLSESYVVPETAYKLTKTGMH